jgi:hypothetical protein
MSEEDRVSPAPHVSHVARISMILGLLSALSVFLAVWGAIVVMKAGICTFLPTDHEYVYPVFWLLWLLLPIGAVICGTYARKTATGQREQRLALLSLVLGYLSLLLVAAVVFSEITLFLRALGYCPPHAPCS